VRLPAPPAEALGEHQAGALRPPRPGRSQQAAARLTKTESR
jgi:hypothetical protein